MSIHYAVAYEYDEQSHASSAWFAIRDVAADVETERPFILQKKCHMKRSTVTAWVLSLCLILAAFLLASKPAYADTYGTCATTVPNAYPTYTTNPLNPVGGSSAVEMGEQSWSTKVAQAFAVIADCSLTNVYVYISKSGTPTDDVTIRIVADASGPTGSTLATSNTVAGSLINSSARWEVFTFASPPTLVESTVYWIVVERSGAVDSNYYRTFGVAFPTNSPALYRYNGSVWTQATSTAAYPLMYQAIGIADFSESAGTISVDLSEMVEALETSRGFTALIAAFFLFLATMFVMIWIIRKH